MKNQEMKVILSDYVNMKYGMINKLSSSDDFKKLKKFLESKEYNRFQTIQDLDGMEDENGNEIVMFFDVFSEFDIYVVYAVDAITLEVNLLLVEEDFKKASRFFYGFKYSDTYFEIHDNLDDGESIMSEMKDGVWFSYVQKFENDEFVSTIELNEYRLNKGLKTIDFNLFEDMYKRA